MADAFDQAGTLGEATTNVESVEPFYVEPKLPLEVTFNDVIQLPVGLVNSTSTHCLAASCRCPAQGFDGVSDQPSNFPAKVTAHGCCCH